MYYYLKSLHYYGSHAMGCSFRAKTFRIPLKVLEGSTKVVNMCYIRKQKYPIYNAML